MMPATKSRSKVVCLAPDRCGARWHWTDTLAPCGAATDVSRRPIATLATLGSPANPRGLSLVDPGGEGLVIDFSESSWEEFSRASVSVHGLHVNRHALTNVVELATSATAKVEALQGDEESLAFEVLCLDADVRKAAVVAALGPTLANDAALVSRVETDFETLLAGMRGTDTVNSDNPTLDSFPYLKARVAGLVDASYEAQKRTHAYDQMVKDVTVEMYGEHPERIGEKWVVRSGHALTAAGEELRPGDVLVNMSTTAGLYDAKVAKEDMTDKQWAEAIAKTGDDEISVTPAALKREAKKREIGVDVFLDESTSNVDLMTAVHGEGDEDGDTKFELDSKTSKADGISEYRRGVTTFGSHFYIPSREGMDENKAFATLVSARARADTRRAEAKGIAATLKETMRKIEPLAVNTTLRYEDSARDFLFQVNKTTEFDKEAFSDAYPDVVGDLRAAARAAGTVAPSKRAILAVLADSLGNEGAAAKVGGYRKPRNSRPLVHVVDKEGSRVEPSNVGRDAAQERVARGEALNGRIITDSSAL